MVITEGALGTKTIWKRISHFPFNMLRKRWQTTILDFLHKHLGNSFYRLKSFLFNNYPDGFYVYAKSNLDSKAHDKISRLFSGLPCLVHLADRSPYKENQELHHFL